MLCSLCSYGNLQFHFERIFCKIPYYATYKPLCCADPAVWFKWDQTVTQTTIKSLVKFVLPDYHWSCSLHTKQLLHNKCLLMCICDDQGFVQKPPLSLPLHNALSSKAFMNKASHFTKTDGNSLVSLGLGEPCVCSCLLLCHNSI